MAAKIFCTAGIAVCIALLVQSGEGRTRRSNGMIKRCGNDQREFLRWFCREPTFEYPFPFHRVYRKSINASPSYISGTECHILLQLFCDTALHTKDFIRSNTKPQCAADTVVTNRGTRECVVTISGTRNARNRRTIAIRRDGSPDYYQCARG